MASEESKANPTLADQVTQVAATVKEEVLGKGALDALLNASIGDVIGYDPETEVVKGGAHRSAGWLHAPAHLQLLAVAERRLTRVAQLAGQTTRKVEKVHPKLIKGTKLLVIQVASPDDLTAVPVNRYAGSSAAWINLLQLLGGVGLTVETGYRERFDVAYVPKGSLLWPGLVIDLSQPRERRREPGARKTPGQAEPATATAVTRQGEDGPKPESGSAAG